MTTKPPAGIELRKEGETNKMFLRAFDSFYKLEVDECLPENFYDLPLEKQRYWMDKTITLVSRKMKWAIFEKTRAKKLDKSCNQISEPNG